MLFRLTDDGRILQEPPATEQILQMLLTIRIQGEVMAGELARLIQEVAETKTAIDSALVLIRAIPQLIRDAGTDPVALEQLASDLDAKQQELAQAIVENTPAAPEP